MIDSLRDFLRRHLNVSRLSLLSWVVFAILFARDPVRHKIDLVLFVVTSATLFMGFLHLTDYFEQVRVLPHRSHVVLAAALTSIAGIVNYAVFAMIDRTVPFSWTSIALGSALVSFGFFWVHARLEWSAARRGHRKKIVLDVLPSEVEELVRLYQASGYLGCIDFLGPTDLKKAVLQQQEGLISQIIISRGGVRYFHDDAYLVRAHLAGIPIVDRRRVIAELSGRIKLKESDTWSYLQAATRQTPFLRTYAEAKQYIEPVLAVALAILLSPVLVAVAVAIRWTSAGPVFYRQVRTGYLGESFELIKFRSMRTDSEASGPQWASAGDDRVTPVGKFIRRTRLDELPQLWNVIRGEMSFIGPRPERPEFYPVLKEKIPLFPIRTNIKPGVTGWAQVCAGYAASVAESETKLEFDLYYIRHVSLRLDLIVLVRTFMVAFLGSERARTMPAVDTGDVKGSVSQPTSAGVEPVRVDA